MDDKLQKIKDIIVRTLLEESSREEQEQLEAWRRENEANEAFYDKICKEAAGRLQEYMKTDISAAFAINQKRLKKSVVRRIVLRSLPYAALLALIWSVTELWPEKKHDVTTVRTESATPPGRRQAELILANGKTLRLEEGMDATIREGAAEVIIQENTIHYPEGLDHQEIIYNRVRTPLGGEYAVKLEDGTEVWLNALSELKYPVRFKGKERRVELQGEAYFKVKQDTARPFYVNFGGYEIKVLGTSFNVKVYNNDDEWQTTLCTGKINFTDLRNRQNVILSPGHQALCNRHSGELSTKEVDPELYTAWTKGEFRFDNTPIEEIFTILQRWYHIDVFYANRQVRKEVFTGKLPRFDQLKTILDIMEKVSDVRFEMRGCTVTVK